MKLLSRWILAGCFIAAGVTHFTHPRIFTAIVPPRLPSPTGLVYASGLAEIAGGLGLLHSASRRAAGWWLIALLWAVFPANIYHAIAADQISGNTVPRWVLVLRLPLQFALMAWVYAVALQRAAAAPHRASKP